MYANSNRQPKRISNLLFLIMKKLTIWLMQYQFKLATRQLDKEQHEVIKKAMQHRVDIFEATILFLR